jgi:hypothetical protein
MVWGGECRFCVAGLGQAPPIAILHTTVRERERKDWDGRENLEPTRGCQARQYVQRAAVAWIVVRVAPSVRKALPCLKGASDESSAVQCAASLFVRYRLIALPVAYAV